MVNYQPETKESVVFHFVFIFLWLVLRQFSKYPEPQEHHLFPPAGNTTFHVISTAIEVYTLTEQLHGRRRREYNFIFVCNKYLAVKVKISKF